MIAATIFFDDSLYVAYTSWICSAIFSPVCGCGNRVQHKANDFRANVNSSKPWAVTPKKLRCLFAQISVVKQIQSSESNSLQICNWCISKVREICCLTSWVDGNFSGQSFWSKSNPSKAEDKSKINYNKIKEYLKYMIIYEYLLCEYSRKDSSSARLTGRILFTISFVTAIFRVSDVITLSAKVLVDFGRRVLAFFSFK